MRFNTIWNESKKDDIKGNKHVKKIVINALQYKNKSSGIGVLIRELYGRYASMTKRNNQIIIANDCEDFPKGKDTQMIQMPWKQSENFKRIFFQSFQMGRKYCKDAVFLTTDSKIPFFYRAVAQ